MRYAPELRAALFLALVLAALYSPAVFEGKLLSPSALVGSHFPWRANPQTFGSDGPYNFMLSDTTLQFEPWREMQLRSLRRGELPLWNEHSSSGSPLLANSQSAIFYPPNLLAWIWKSQRSFTMAALLKLWLAGMFMFLFLRSRLLGEVPALLGATGLMAGGWFTIWVNHPLSQSAVALPLLFWCIELWVRRSSRLGLLGVAAAVALGLLGGHPETTIHLVAAGSAYALYRLWASGTCTLRLSLEFIAAEILGCGLAAVHVVPFLEFLSESHLLAFRGATFQDGGVPWVGMITLLVPKFFGAHQSFTWWLRETPPLYPNFIEMSAYVGGVSMILAIASISLWRRRPEIRFFWGLAAVCGGLAYSPWLQSRLHWVPILGVTNQGRLLLEVGFALCVCAAITCDAWLRESDASRAPIAVRSLWAATFVLCITIGLFWGGFRCGYSHPVLDSNFSFWCLGASIVLLVAAGLLQLMITRAPGATRVVALALLALAAGDLIAQGRNAVGFLDPRGLAPSSPTIEFLKSDPEPFRLLSVGGALPDAMNLFYDLDSVTGFDVLEVDAYYRLLEPLRTSEFIDSGGEISEQEHALLDRLNVKYLLAPPGVELTGDGIQAVRRGPGGTVFRNDTFWPRVFWVDQAAFAQGNFKPDPDVKVETLQRASASSLYRTTTPDDGVLCIAETHFPGWVSWVDDHQVGVETWSTALRAIPVPAGTHDIELRYRPLSFRTGAWLSVLSLLLACVIGFVSIRNERNRGDERNEG